MADNSSDIPVICCDTLRRVLGEGEVMDSFRGAVSIISDYGHGGSEQIKFCPFCGKEITFPDPPGDLFD